MNYCENCYCVTRETRCPLCGSNRLREVLPDDFCVLLEDDAARCRPIMFLFDEKHIPYSSIACGNGINAVFALPLDRYRLFVPYEKLQEAKALLEDNERKQTEQLRAMLLNKRDRLFLSAKTEKSIRRKHKALKDRELVSYCAELIENAEKIDDRGIDSDARGGHYVLCYGKEQTLSLNSQTMEILSLK